MPAEEITMTLPPMHPGEVLREEFIEPLGLSAGKVAKACGVPRTRIERIIREEVGISGDTALRLARFFKTTPDFWMNLQKRYELLDAEQNADEQLEQIKAFDDPNAPELVEEDTPHDEFVDVVTKYLKTFELTEIGGGALKNLAVTSSTMLPTVRELRNTMIVTVQRWSRQNDELHRWQNVGSAQSFEANTQGVVLVCHPTDQKRSLVGRYN